ncbi:MAG TPA: hypothetical protein VH496_09245, partial [Mycobacterium sp.]
TAAGPPWDSDIKVAALIGVGLCATAIPAAAEPRPQRVDAWNYGLNEMRIQARVRRARRSACVPGWTPPKPCPHGVQVTVGVTIEYDRTDKPVCVAEAVYRIHSAPLVDT